MVDIPRKSQKRQRFIKRIVYSVIILGAAGAIVWYLSKLEPADPTVDLDLVWTDTVKRGPMLRQVRGLGKLVPEETRWVTATTNGRVENISLQPGARVAPDTVLLELSNSQLEQETVNAEWDWKAAQTSLEDLRVTLEDQQLTQTAEIARVESEYAQAVLRFEADSELAEDGLISSLELKLKKETTQQLSRRLEIERERFESRKKSIDAQLAVQQTRIDQLQAVYALKKSQLDQLKVRAGVRGVLQLVSVEVGQHVSPGANLALVANPNRLKAELNIAETQAKDIQEGQEVSIDTRNGIIPGRVSRIDPSVIDGTVTVDVRLEAELPKDARPELSVDGTIVLDRLVDVLYVGRPVQGQENSRIGIFKLDPDRTKAERVTVSLGTGSVNTIEIREGLKAGDEVILSDMTAQDGYDSIRLK